MRFFITLNLPEKWTGSCQTKLVHRSKILVFSWRQRFTEAISVEHWYSVQLRQLYKAENRKLRGGSRLIQEQYIRVCRVDVDFKGNWNWNSSPGKAPGLTTLSVNETEIARVGVFSLFLNFNTIFLFWRTTDSAVSETAYLSWVSIIIFPKQRTDIDWVTLNHNAIHPTGAKTKFVK